MSVFDRLLNTVRLNDDYDEDDEFYDEEDEVEDEKQDSGKSSRFSRKIEETDDSEDDELDDLLKDYDNSEDDDLEEDNDEYSARRFQKKSRLRAEKKSTRRAARDNTDTFASGSSKITPMKRKDEEAEMEVCVIKPTSMEDTREIADTLLDKCTVVLNLEGMDVDIAQRIIDFSSGACYAINGQLQKVSSYIFLLTPEGVEITGDIQDLLSDAIPSFRNDF